MIQQTNTMNMRHFFLISAIVFTSAINILANGTSILKPISDIHDFYKNDGEVFQKAMRLSAKNINKSDPKIAAEVETNLNLPILYRTSLLQTCDEVTMLVSKSEHLSTTDKKEIAWRLVFIIETIAESEKIDTEVILKLDSAFEKAGISNNFRDKWIRFQSKEQSLLMDIAQQLKIFIQTEF